MTAQPALDVPNESMWPIGEPWPAHILPGPAVAVELCALELEILIAEHYRLARANFDAGEGRASLYHALRMSYLRQQLALVEPHRLSNAMGTA